jgi:cytochrome c556
LKLTQELKEAFQRVGNYFDAWGDAQDAVDDSKQYQKKLDEITAFLQQKDFGSASSAAVDFAKNCDKACHDKYKPL